jgi:hypothetical protein
MWSAEKITNPIWDGRFESTSNSITTQLEQHLILDEKDIPLVREKKIVIVDDVLSARINDASHSEL